MHTRCECVRENSFVHLSHQIRERCERDELSIRKCISPRRHSVHGKPINIMISGRNQLIRNVYRALNMRGIRMLIRRRHVQTSPLIFGDHRDQVGRQTPCLSFGPNIFDINRGFVADGNCVSTTNRPVIVPLWPICVVDNLVVDLAVTNCRTNPRFLPFLLRQPPCTYEGHLDRVSRVGAGNGTRPDPRDNRVFCPSWCHYLRVKVPDSMLCLIPHLLSVVSNILREPLGALISGLFCNTRVNGGTSSKSWRNIDQRFIDKNCQWVEIRRLSVAPEPLSLQGNRPAPRKRIDDGRHVSAIGTTNLRTRLVHQSFISAVFPYD